MTRNFKSAPRASSGISKETFDYITGRISATFAPIFNQEGKTLIIKKDWSSDFMTAYSKQSAEESQIFISGGIARRNLTDEDNFLFIMCHEIGHFLGGFPRSPTPEARWASVEGQADYFATAKCMKLILKGDPRNEEKARALDLPRDVKKSCQSQYPEREDYNICLISAKAAVFVGEISNVVWSEKHRIDLTRPDRTVTTITLDKYPENNQCRTDSAYQGALCNVDPEIPFSSRNERDGACLEGMGARPKCWFKPAGRGLLGLF